MKEMDGNTVVSLPVLKRTSRIIRFLDSSLDSLHQDFKQSQGFTSHSSLRPLGDRCDHIGTTWATCADCCGWGDGQTQASGAPFFQES